MPITINGTTGIAGVDGSASTPAIQGTDTNTGVTFPAADTVAISTGGTERVRIASSGNLGVGTNSPTEKLTVYAASGYTAMSVYSGSANGRLFATSGEVGVQSVNSGDILTFSTNSGSGATERARFDASGDLYWGNAKNILPHQVSGNTNPGFAVRTQYCIEANNKDSLVGIFNRTNSTGAIVEWKYNAAVIGSVSTNGTSTSYNTSSDYRLKENVQPMQNALATIAQLNPVTYTWKADGSDGQGFIAHELQAVVPDCVTGQKDAVDADGNPMYQGVDTSFLVATLTKAIQELKAELDAANARIAALEAK